MRRGFTLVEVLFALTFSFLLAAAAWSLILVHSRGSREAAATADRLDAARVVRGVLTGEIQVGREGRDWTLFGRDSLALRAFRGVAVPCGPAISGVVAVRVRSPRRPEPTKDSLLVLRLDGRWEALDLLDAASLGPGSGGSPATPSCGPAEMTGDVETWTVPGLDEGFVLARIFERGSYHLVDQAFRYRTGGGGRQPLIPSLLDPGDSMLEAPAAGSGSLRLILAFQKPRGSSAPLVREATLWLHQP